MFVEMMVYVRIIHDRSGSCSTNNFEVRIISGDLVELCRPMTGS
jgi:hypothetical protein